MYYDYEKMDIMLQFKTYFNNIFFKYNHLAHNSSLALLLNPQISAPTKGTPKI